MLRRQGLPPSCPHPEKWLVPVELPVSLLPGAQGGWDSQTLGSCVLCRGNVAVEGIKDGNHSLLEYRSSPASPFMRKSGAGPKGRFQKAGHRASLRAVRVEGTTDLLRRAKGFAAPRRRRRIVFTPRAAAIPPQAGYLRSVPQAGNAASGRSHTCTRPDSRDPRSRPRGPHAADSAP